MGDRQQKRYADDWQEWHDYMAAKQQKLNDQFVAGYNVTPGVVGQGGQIGGQMFLTPCPPISNAVSTLFNGVSIFVIGYTIPSANELRQLMQYHGGLYHFQYDRTTTHIIATNLANAKINTTPLQKVVKPEWITDSIRAGRLLPCEPYMPYSIQPPSQTLLNFPPVWSSGLPPPPSSTPLYAPPPLHAAPTPLHPSPPTLHPPPPTLHPPPPPSVPPIPTAPPLVTDPGRPPEGFYRPYAPLDQPERYIVVSSEYPTELCPVSYSQVESQRYDNYQVVQALPKIAVPSLPVVLDRESNWIPTSGTYDHHPVVIQQQQEHHHEPSPQQHQYMEDHYGGGGGPGPSAGPANDNSLPPLVISDVRHHADAMVESRQVANHPLMVSMLEQHHHHSTPPQVVPCRQEVIHLDRPHSEVIHLGRPSEVIHHLDRPPPEVIHLDRPPSEVILVDRRTLNNIQMSEHPSAAPFQAQPKVVYQAHPDVQVHHHHHHHHVQAMHVHQDDEEEEVHDDDDVHMRDEDDAAANQESDDVILDNQSVFDDDDTSLYRLDPALYASQVTDESKADGPIGKRSEEDRPQRAGDPDFLSEFYSRSRLHYISTMRLEFQDHVADMQHNWNGAFAGHRHLRELMDKDEGAGTVREPLFTPVTSYSNMIPKIPQSFTNINRIIMHIDMDCFFVSVGLRRYSQHRGKPVAVSHTACGGGGPGGTTEDDHQRLANSKSEVASCNYEARDMGVTNGMFLGEALRLCPDLVTIPYDFDAYKDVAKKLYSIVASYTQEIEAVSCDEMYVDCTNVLRATGASPEQLAACIRDDVERNTECTCSIGIARNFLLARMATRRAKPNGVFRILVQDEAEFMFVESVRNLPGVGPALGLRLWNMNIETCAELQNVSLQSLKTSFGPKTGQSLFNLCRGVDDREIQRPRPRQSVSAEVNYGIRFVGHPEVIRFLADIAKEVSARLKRMGSKGSVFTLKMKIRKSDAPLETAKFLGHGACINIARSVALHVATDSAPVIWRECGRILKRIDPIPSDIRGMGIQVSKLCHASSTRVRYTLRGFQVSNDTADSHQDEKYDMNGPLSEMGAGGPNVADADSFDEGTEDQHCLSKDLPLLEVKALIKDWVELHDEPLQEDLDVVGNFLCGAIEDLNLEKVDVILKFLLKAVSTRQNPAKWIQASRDVALKVQLKMKQWYGGQIKICFPPKFFI